MLTNLNIAGGAMQYGAFQLPQNIASSPTGAVLFVNSADGLDSRSRLNFFGTPQNITTSVGSGPQGSPNKPLATVFGTNGALSYCSASRGDIVIVLPGHTENLSANAAYGVPAGVTILGVGYVGVRPAFTFTGGAGTTISLGAGCTVQNCFFDLTGVASVAKGFAITGASRIVDCRIVQASSTNQATDAVIVGASDFTMQNVSIDATAAAGAGAGVAAGAAISRLKLLSCSIQGNFSVANVSAPTSDTITNFLMDSCILTQSNGTAKIVLSFVAAVTGIIQYCTFASASATTNPAGLFSGSNAALWWLQNYGADTMTTALTSGLLSPVAGTFT
jgi:hypothetical protein